MIDEAFIRGQIEQARDLDYIGRRIDDAKMVVVDEETEGLDWRVHQTVGHVLTFSGDPRDSFYLPIRHKGSGNLDPDKVNALLAQKLKRQTLRTVGFNYSFDLKFMQKDGITVDGPLEDGMINSFLIDENQRSFSLDACCVYMRVQEKKGDELYAHLASKFGGNADRKQMGNFHKLAGDDLLGVDYSIGDGTSTMQLVEKQQPDLDAQDLRRVWEVECRCIRALHRMTWRGVRIDEERLDQIRRIVDHQINQARSRLPKDFNERAPTNLVKLFTDAGITDWPTTPRRINAKGKETGGAPSFAEPWLLQSPLGRDVVAVRKFTHMRDSFLIPLAERHLFRGRVHTTYNQTRGEEFGTTTGRLSSSGPNLQQVHKRNEVLGSLFRSIFIPDPGMVWSSEDYNQVEPRLLAHYGHVQILIDGYLADPPIDAHSMVAMTANISRQAGKTTNQALLTGAGVGKIKKMLQVPDEEADRIMLSYFSSMPEIKSKGFQFGGREMGIQPYADRIYKARGYIKSWLGRRSRLDNPDFSYKGLNRILQLGNADILKKAMVDVDEYLASEGDVVQLLGNCHDSIDHEFRPEHRHVHNEILRIMTDFGPGKSVEFTVPFPLEVDEGPNWAVASYGEGKVRDAFKQMGGSYDKAVHPVSSGKAA